MPTDFLGTMISVGDSIVFPSRSSSDYWLRTGIVSRVDPERIRVHTDASPVLLSRLDRVVVVKSAPPGSIPATTEGTTRRPRSSQTRRRGRPIYSIS